MSVTVRYHLNKLPAADMPSALLPPHLDDLAAKTNNTCEELHHVSPMQMILNEGSQLSLGCPYPVSEARNSSRHAERATEVKDIMTVFLSMLIVTVDEL